jgi:type II secretory pathway component PulF
MAKFSYKAFDSAGAIKSGSLEATSKDEALELISQKELTLLSLKQQKQVINSSRRRVGRVKSQSILILTRQLLSLIHAGIPLVESLELIIDQSSDEKMQEILKILNEDVKEGKSFSDSLRQFPNVFSELYINSIQIGETGGILEKSLKNLISQLENEMKISKDLKKALKYPAFLIVTLIMAFIVFTMYVIPNFMPIFTKGGTDLPIPTQIMILMSDLFTSYGIIALFALVLLIIAYYGYYRTEKGKYNIHYLQLKLPLFGNLFKKISTQRFCETVAILIGQGIPLVKAMNTAQNTETNLFFKEQIENIKDKVETGQNIAAAIKSVNIFPKIMIHMVSVGELTGTLEEMMIKVAEFNHSEISTTINGLTSLIEPVVTIILGVMVLFLALSIFLPMWNMMGLH